MKSILTFLFFSSQMFTIFAGQQQRSIVAQNATPYGNYGVAGTQNYRLPQLVTTQNFSMSLLQAPLINAQREISLGSSVPLTGGVSLLGKDITYGFNLIFTKCNREGGIAGAQIKLNSLDDKYQPTLTKANIQTLLQKSPFFIGCFGTEGNLTLLSELQNKKIASFFPITGAPQIRRKDFSTVICFRPSIEQEVRALVKYAVDKACKRKIAIFYEENRWGKAGLEAAEKALEALEIKAVVKCPYLPNTVIVNAAIADMLKAQTIEATICISHIWPSYTFIKEVVNKVNSNMLFLGVADLAPMQAQLKKSRGVSLVCASVVPDPNLSQLPIVVQYRANMKSFLPNVEISPFSLEGYICASLLVEVLRVVPYPQTVGMVMAQLEALKNYNFKGILLNFDPETRQLSSHVWINDGSGKEWALMSY